MLTYTKSHKMTILLYKAMHIYKVCTHVLNFDFALCLERKLKNLTKSSRTQRIPNRPYGIRDLRLI